MYIILLRIGHKVKCGQHKDRLARRCPFRCRRCFRVEKVIFLFFFFFSWIQSRGLVSLYRIFFSSSLNSSLLLKKKKEKLVLIASIQNTDYPRVIMGVITVVRHDWECMNVQRLDITSLH